LTIPWFAFGAKTGVFLLELSTNGEKGGPLSWPMVVLILATGAGNFWATKEGTSATGANRAEIDQVVRQVGDMHRELEGFKERQLEELDALGNGVKNQTQMLENQNRQMENDTKVLGEIERAIAPLSVERALPGK
jgi:hypothetical protein